jgi:7-cyano-7-deazaguanine reductase
MNFNTSASMNEIAARSLGDSTSYAVYTDKFDSSLLNPMPRKLAREHWGITGKEFVGVDVWHCHEATFLLDNGCPVAGTLKFVYDANTEFMVESKSVKLYLNSFDMCKMGATIEEATANYETQVAQDLSRVVGGHVDVKFFDSIQFVNNPPVQVFDDASDLYMMIGAETLSQIKFTDYTAQESHIQLDPNIKDLCVMTNVLRSRCRHTKQKDTGAAYITHQSKFAAVEPISLLRQIVSLREVNEFHEFCAEKLFIEIQKKAQEDDNIIVALLYSRRGSLDINPIRATKLEEIPASLRDVNVLTMKAQGQ